MVHAGSRIRDRSVGTDIRQSASIRVERDGADVDTDWTDQRDEDGLVIAGHARRTSICSASGGLRASRAIRPHRSRYGRRIGHRRRLVARCGSRMRRRAGHRRSDRPPDNRRRRRGDDGAEHPVYEDVRRRATSRLGRSVLVLRGDRRAARARARRVRWRIHEDRIRRHIGPGRSACGMHVPLRRDHRGDVLGAARELLQRRDVHDVVWDEEPAARHRARVHDARRLGVQQRARDDRRAAADRRKLPADRDDERHAGRVVDDIPAMRGDYAARWNVRRRSGLRSLAHAPGEAEHAVHRAPGRRGMSRRVPREEDRLRVVQRHTGVLRVHVLGARRRDVRHGHGDDEH